jgi:putative endonuclease
MYFVYTLYAEKFDKIYVGSSEDPEKRLKSHNDLRNKGWTKRFQPWKIIFTEQCDSKSTALIREKQLKSSRGRDYIRSYILNNQIINNNTSE